MRYLLRFGVVVSCLLLCACARVRVATDYDPSTSFAALRDWAWAQREPDTGDERRIADPLRDARIERAVEELLVDRGYRRVDAAEADFLVAFRVDLEQRVEVSDVPGAFGYWGFWGGFYGTRSYAEVYDERRLLIDVLDAQDERLIWRGVGTERLRDYATPQEREENIRRVVAAILERFPPAE